MTKRQVKNKKQASKSKNRQCKSKAKSEVKGVAWYINLGVCIFNFFKSLFISFKGM
jgi:hypothetical protein